MARHHIASLKSLKKESDLELDPDLEPDPDPLVKGTDPGIRIRIRTKMSRIPNMIYTECQLYMH
jgi:hypothetical protein